MDQNWTAAAANRRVPPTVAGLSDALAGTDLGPWRAETLHALSPEQLATGAALLDHLRGLLDEELCRAAALADAEDELERLVRREWRSCLHGEIQDPGLRRGCELAQQAVERLERGLRTVRAARLGLGEEIRALLRGARPADGARLADGLRPAEAERRASA
jgi:hypothetical protein